MSRPTPAQIAKSGDEDSHQTALFACIATGVNNGTLNPKLDRLYAIPNGGSRGDTERTRKLTGGLLKQTGVKPGIPDIHLPVARHGFHSLYIELKRPNSKRGAAGIVSEKQIKWHDILREEGHAVLTCYGWEPALQALIKYLDESSDFRLTG